jgi:hypothetical protein
MTRIRLWHVLTLLTAAVASVSFLVGYLDARDTVPGVAAATVPAPPAIVSGTVTDASGPITIQTREGQPLTLDIPPDQPVTASIPITREDLEVGDLIIVAFGHDTFGGQAIRAIIKAPGGGSDGP